MDSRYYSYDNVAKRATIYLKVQAASSRNVIEDFILIGEKYYLKIYITESPVDGKANKSIIKFLSKSWKLKQNQLEFTKGANQNIKLLDISNIEENEINRILENYARFP